MGIAKFFTTRTIAFAAVVGVLALGIFAFAAQNTVPDTAAGDGDGDVSGFTISNVNYDLDETDPSEIASVTFDIEADNAALGDPEDVQIAFLDGQGDVLGVWHESTSIVGSTVTVNLASNQAIEPVEGLRVVAANADVVN